MNGQKKRRKEEYKLHVELGGIIKARANKAKLSQNLATAK
jgi:hypothetical protein